MVFLGAVVVTGLICLGVGFLAGAVVALEASAAERNPRVRVDSGNSAATVNK